MILDALTSRLGRFFAMRSLDEPDPDPYEAWVNKQKRDAGAMRAATKAPHSKAKRQRRNRIAGRSRARNFR